MGSVGSTGEEIKTTSRKKECHSLILDKALQRWLGVREHLSVSIPSVPLVMCSWKTDD